MKRSNTKQAIGSYVFLLLSLFFSLLNSSSAQSNPQDGVELFCKEASKESEKVSLKQTFKSMMDAYRFLLTPKKMITVHSLNPMAPLDKPALGEKYIFILFPNKLMTESDKQILETRSKLLEEFKSTGIPKKIGFASLKKQLSYENCINIFKKDEKHFEISKKYFDFAILPSTSLAIQKHYNEGYFLKIDDFLKKYVKMGWKIKKIQHYSEILATLNSDTNIRQFMMISHAADTSPKPKNEGDPIQHSAVLLNSNNTLIDSKFFHAIPNTVDKVIMIACHGEGVINTYKLNELAFNFDFYYATPAKNIETLKGRVPLYSREAFIDSAKANFSNYKKSPKECAFEIESHKEKNSLQIRLSNQLLGVMTGKKIRLSFDCNLLNSKNNLLIEHMKDTGDPVSSPELSSITLFQPNASKTEIKFRELLYGDKEFRQITGYLH